MNYDGIYYPAVRVDASYFFLNFPNGEHTFFHFLSQKNSKHGGPLSPQFYGQQKLPGYLRYWALVRHEDNKITVL